MSLSPEVLSIILSYADNDDLLHCRLVNTQWYGAAQEQGCIFLRFEEKKLFRSSCVYSLRADGHCVDKEILNKELLNELKVKMNSKEEIRKSFLRRTRGHLPEPRMPPFPQKKDPSDSSSSTWNATLQVLRHDEHHQQRRSSSLHCIARINVDSKAYLSLDLSSAALIIIIMNRSSCSENLPEYVDKQSAKNTLQEINLSSLCHLQHVCLRGMASLTKISLPPSIVALDASGCSKLQQIHVPMIGSTTNGKSLELVSFNLNGCRSLRHIFGATCKSMEQAMGRIQELDMTSTLQLPQTIRMEMLKAAKCLISISLRYVATDEILSGLAQSIAATSTLKFVDVAFSQEVTDGAVDGLIQSATNLERLNLRGCRNISSECFYNTPVLLHQRKEGKDNAGPPKTCSNKIGKTDSAVAVNRHLRPNHELTDEERSAKRELKRLLKRQGKRKKFETRLQQAIKRGDEGLEKKYRQDLEAFLEEEQSERQNTNQKNIVVSPIPVRNAENRSSDEQDNSGENTESQQAETRALKQIVTMNMKLQQILKEKQKGEQTDKDALANNSATKEFQMAQARELLQNMTKGTQTECMFENRDALIGYTTEKFPERAALVLSSLCKLDPRRWSVADTNKMTLNQDIATELWNKLCSGTIRWVCSVGCGPGCDVTGLLTFFHHFARKSGETLPHSLVDSVSFLDWTMERWDFVLKTLVEDILYPDNLIRTSQSAFCDVREHLYDKSNTAAQGVLLGTDKTKGTAITEVDIFITSYLLTETREKWQAFFSDLINIAKRGALFFFAEPKAWQLHMLIQQSSSQMDFVWLDSSMHSPELQALERRVGPAVLLGIKR